MLVASVTVSAIGLIIGLLLLIACVWLGQWGARQTGYAWLRIVGVVVGLILFVVLGFDFSDETATVD